MNIEEINLEDPWYIVEEGSEQFERLQKELLLEMGHKHYLLGLSPIVVAMSERNDDIVVSLNNSKFAFVHLSWCHANDANQYKWPYTEIFSTQEELENYFTEQLSA